jgi:hypothetical protein
LRYAGNRGELFETSALVIVTKRSFGKKIHGEQDAHQEHKKSQREFPE